MKVLSAATLVLAIAIPATPAAARPGGGADRITTAGQCSSGSTWILSGRSRFLRVVVEARVSTHPRQRWTIRLDHNQALIAAMSRKSTGRGVLKVKGRVANAPGPDTFSFVARNRNTAEICQGTLTF